MLRWIALLLPAVIPSWRFFQTIEPSPRVEYRVVGGDWVEACPVPARVSLRAMLWRLVWNPARNDALFLTSLAERVLLDGRDHAQREIMLRLRDVVGSDVEEFRLITVQRVGSELVRDVAFVSVAERSVSSPVQRLSPPPRPIDGAV